ncbi:ARM repeat-containing protein [Violaceomyces palustris]|uniref:ARM repeat-containing protein n=1 Tax=Violaceomyces palustris TaxID=1673888 RepID=A0ACD0P1G5_9BASI|nr:ARM repeat-containing protein [Violaceomyces palustris]
MASSSSSSSSSSLSHLVQVLHLATSHDPNHMAQANRQLDELETQPELWQLLLDIAFLRQPLPPTSNPIRSLAIIRFKNGIEKYWRSRIVSTRTVTIPPELKSNIRHTLLSGALAEQDRLIALQASVSISKIARHDYPTQWPNLFADLQIAMVQAHSNLQTQPDDLQNTLVLMRAADVLARTLKELESVKILAGKLRMSELSRQLLPSLHPIFQHYFAETFHIAPSPPHNDSLRSWALSPLRAERIRTSHLLLKAISRLAVADLGMITTRSTTTVQPSSSSSSTSSTNLAQSFFLSTPSSLQTLKDTRLAYLNLIRSSSSALDPKLTSNLTAAMTRHLHCFGKLFLALIQKEKGKAAFWQGWTDVVWWYWVQAKQVPPESLSVPRESFSDHSAPLDYPPKFVVHALVLLKRSLQEWKGGESAGAFSTFEFAVEATEVLVGKLMRLSSDDLERWQSDAEDWCLGEEQENFELDIRPAAERALLVLAQTTCPTGVVGEHLWSIFENSGSELGTESLDHVLARDAIYAAVGRCRDHLSRPGEDDERPEEHIKMGKAIRDRLIAEASLNDGSAAAAALGPLWIIIRRRIAWLLWEWSEQVLVESRPRVYSLLVDLLDQVPGQTDAAVRLASARCLSALADALEFDPDAFNPFLPAALSRLATLAASGDLHEISSIKTCTDSLSILIERMGARVAPHSEALTQLVPALWSNPDEECKVRPSILVFVGKLVKAVELLPNREEGVGGGGGGSWIHSRLHSVVEPIVRQSLDPKVSHMLGKDALNLWSRSLHSSPEMTVQLFSLLELAPQLVSQPDFTVEVCRVLEEAFLLSPIEILKSQHAKPILESLANVIADPINPMVLSPLACLDLLVQSLDQNQNGGCWWLDLLVETNVLTALVGSLVHTVDSAVITTHFINVLSRITYQTRVEPGRMNQTIQTTLAPRLGFEPGREKNLWKTLIEIWCQRLENMSSIRKRRITALGLAVLLVGFRGEQGREVLRFGMGEMINVFINVLTQIRQEGDRDVQRYKRPTSPLGNYSIEEEFEEEEDVVGFSTSPGSARSRNLTLKDPCLNGETIRILVRQSIRSLDPPSCFEGVDPLILEELFRELE